MTDYAHQPKPTSQRLGWIAGGLLLTTLLVAAVYMVDGWLSPANSAHQSTTVLATPQEDLTSRLLVVGDVFWGRQVQRRAEASPLQYAYPMSGLSAADRDTYDGWIANFECPVTDRDVPYSQQVDILRFNCRPEYLPELAKWFSAVTLANNHMDNNGGQQGLDETRQNLEQAGIQYAGTFNMQNTADICEVVSLPAKVGTTKAFLPVALCGFMQVVDVQPTDAQLSVMEQYSRYMPVIALPHMGIEYRTSAEAAKVTAYHAMIDHGADVVIGAHPHVIQNSEYYHGKLITYSVGNFLFDQQGVSRDTTLGLGVDIALQVKAGTMTRKYQQLAANCQAFKDSCLASLAQAGDMRPPIMVQYKYRCFDISSNVPVAGDSTACAQADQRANASILPAKAQNL